MVLLLIRREMNRLSRFQDALLTEAAVSRKLSEVRKQVGGRHRKTTGRSRDPEPSC